MNKIKFLLAAFTLTCVTFLSGCEEDPPPVERKPDTLTYLKSFDIYDISGHTCLVETSTDCYKYHFTLSDREYYYLTGTEEDENNWVPVGMVDTMSTLGLMESILKNPVWYYAGFVWEGEGYISDFLSNSDNRYSYFNQTNPGLLDKFYGREDATSVLVERYTGMYPTCSDNNYSSGYAQNDTKGLHISSSFMEIQLLMAEEPILTQLTDVELHELSVHIVKTYITLMENPYADIYLFNIQSLALLATRIMENVGYLPFTALYGELHNSRMVAIDKFRPIGSSSYAQLMICFNNFIQEEL